MMLLKRQPYYKPFLGIMLLFTAGLCVLNKNAMAQFRYQDYLFLSKQSGIPRLYVFPYKYEPASVVFKDPIVWNLSNGQYDSANIDDIQSIKPHFLQQANDGKWVYIGKSSDYRKLCTVGDSLLVTDLKQKNIFLVAPSGEGVYRYKKVADFEVLHEARKGEDKMERKFVIEYSLAQKKFFFIRQGALCSMGLDPASTVEEIIKPVGGLQLAEFTLSPSADHAVLLFVASSEKISKHSSLYFNYTRQLFDLRKKKPLIGIPLRMNGTEEVLWTFSMDGKRMLTWCVNGGRHTGAFYNLETGEEIRRYGPLIYKLAGDYWIKRVDDRYLYTFSTKNKVVKIYDLLDSLRPVKSLQLGSKEPANCNKLPPEGSYAALKKNAGLEDIINALPQLPFPLKLETFTGTITGHEIPAPLWKNVGFYMPARTDGTDRNPTTQDSAKGLFKVKAVGILSSSAKGKLLLLASKFMVNRNFEYGETESYSVIRYWVMGYDEQLKRIISHRMVLDDDRNFLDSHHSYELPYTFVKKDQSGKPALSFGNGSSTFNIDTETLQNAQ